MVFNGPSIYPNLMFFVFSIKSVEDIYDFLSSLFKFGEDLGAEEMFGMAEEIIAGQSK